MEYFTFQNYRDKALLQTSVKYQKTTDSYDYPVNPVINRLAVGVTRGGSGKWRVTGSGIESSQFCRRIPAARQYRGRMSVSENTRLVMRSVIAAVQTPQESAPVCTWSSPPTTTVAIHLYETVQLL